MSNLTLTIDQPDALIDADRRITVSGAQPGARVTLVAETIRADLPWSSETVFEADASGMVDLTRDAPVSGAYGGVSPMGVIWAEAPVTEQDAPPAIFNADMAQPLITRLSARSDDARAEAVLTQRLMADGVTREAVDEGGLIGALYRPAGDPHAPAVVILNGSGGGVNEPRAALWASHGYNALALGYFGAPGLPRYISNTPLEYFAKGFDWLRRKVQPRKDFVAVSGQSRGGELALLLGATFPERVSAVIGYVPSAFVHGGQAAADPAIGRDGPCWLLDGKPLVHLWQGNRAASWERFDAREPGWRHTDAMITALGDPEATARARIPVERISGPVMLLSGGEDGSWPSDLFSLIVRNSLIASNHPHPVRWENFPAAGHSILFPHVPTTGLRGPHPVSNAPSIVGGNAFANAEANAQSWAAVLEWMQEATADP